MKKCFCGEHGFGLTVFYEPEPYGSTYVDVPKGLEPCTCWRGKLRRAWRFAWYLARANRHAIKAWQYRGHFEEEDDIPF